ncbi:MAG: Mut7-C ubiquitin/RNAse domain-containing protein [Acidobacteriia bacterium]|nr:Mut7-C ubiquitin/RNAse domain-containing protein [Terriglobia bacterium]
MAQARFRFYAELNDFLPPERRFVEFPYEFLDIATVKDRIESFGVPHTEVDLILVNGDPVDFSYRVRGGDRVSVYPVFESFDIAPLARLRPEPLRDPRFVLDTHLGKLAAYLRMMGFDALYRSCFEDEELARISREERRILLTRDVGLLKRGSVTHGYFVRETDSRRQLAEVVRRFDLARLATPFTRCMRCNALLEDAPKPEILHLLPLHAAAAYEQFRMCPQCRRVYWQGSHYDRMRKLIEAL